MCFRPNIYPITNATQQGHKAQILNYKWPRQKLYRQETMEKQMNKKRNECFALPCSLRLVNALTWTVTRPRGRRHQRPRTLQRRCCSAERYSSMWTPDWLVETQCTVAGWGTRKWSTGIQADGNTGTGRKTSTSATFSITNRSLLQTPLQRQSENASNWTASSTPHFITLHSMAVAHSLSRLILTYSIHTQPLFYALVAFPSEIRDQCNRMRAPKGH